MAIYFWFDISLFVDSIKNFLELNIMSTKNTHKQFELVIEKRKAIICVTIYTFNIKYYQFSEQSAHYVWSVDAFLSLPCIVSNVIR